MRRSEGELMDDTGEEMGLDITAYRQLKEAGAEGRDADGDLKWPGFVEVSVNPDFPTQAVPLVDGAVYATEEDNTFGFRAGSYSGYGAWREQLARMVGYPAENRGAWEVPAEGPFVELVNFSDCEGVIGPNVAAKLAADFAHYQPAADAQPDEWFRAKYAEWRKACDFAADAGLIDFH